MEDQLPGPFRPLTRARGATIGRPSPSTTQSDFILSHRRSRSHDSLTRLTEPVVKFTTAPNSPEKPGDNATAPTPRKSKRPAHPHRRVSSKVLRDTKDLRRELDTLQQQLSDQEVARQRELLIVNFTVNRIFEVQRNQMEVQMRLVDRFNDMEMKPESEDTDSQGDGSRVSTCEQGQDGQQRRRSRQQGVGMNDASGSSCPHTKARCQQQ